MSRATAFEAAVPAGVVAPGERHRALLRSIAETARAIFGARAAAILVLDADAGELVVEAAAGGTPIAGRRYSTETTIAGWVLAMRQPLVLADVDAGPCFAPELAQTPGRVPAGLMAAPLLHEECAIGVLEVLDRPDRPRFTPAELELLGLFAGQAEVAVDLLERGRRAEATLTREHRDLAVVARLSATLHDSRRGAAGTRLLEALEEVLR